MRRVLDLELDPASISVPRAIEFPTGDGGVAHAFYYPPTSAECDGPEDERPPLRVDLPRRSRPSHTPPYLDLEIQYFTQRGIGVVDVNYRGSSGFGRAYRRLLNGRWGEIDWRDCVAAARASQTPATPTPAGRGSRAGARAATSSSARSSSSRLASRPASACSASPTRRRWRARRTSSSRATSTR